MTAEICPYSELVWSECGKIRTRTTPNTDISHAVMIMHDYRCRKSSILGYYNDFLKYFIKECHKQLKQTKVLSEF